VKGDVWEYRNKYLTEMTKSGETKTSAALTGGFQVPPS